MSLRRSLASALSANPPPGYFRLVALAGIEAATLIGASIATVTTWTVAIRLKWNFRATGVTLTGISLSVLKSTDKYVYPPEVDVPTATFLGRFFVALTLCLVSLHSSGLQILSVGPREPLSLEKPKTISWLTRIINWFHRKETVKEASGPFVQCLFGVLTILAFMRALEYFIILMKRNVVVVPSVISNLLGQVQTTENDD